METLRKNLALSFQSVFIYFLSCFETYVRLGDHDYEREGETKFAVDIYVVKQWKHEGYKDCCEDKDIGLL